MEDKNYFGKYTLARTTLDNLKEIEVLLQSNDRPADYDEWNIIKPNKKDRQAINLSIVKHEVQDDNVEENNVARSIAQSSTQCFFSQRDQRMTPPSDDTELIILTKWLDVAESLRESLESTNDKLHQLENLKNLSDDEAKSVIEFLSRKLTLKGTYNLCHSICAMNVEQSMVYIRMTCSNLLLKKIIDLNAPSRLMTTVIHELVEKFPEDVQEFIYTPMLNEEIQDTTVFSAIINGYPSQRKNDLILNFLTVVAELKEWHIGVLSQLINSKITDNVARDKLLDLLLNKASVYSRDKNYGKFILSFIKFNAPFNETGKRKLGEIVATNETIFKRVMENLLTNMYLYDDLWHIA